MKFPANNRCNECALNHVDLSTPAFLALEPAGGTVGVAKDATIVYLKGSYNPNTGLTVGGSLLSFLFEIGDSGTIFSSFRPARLGNSGLWRNGLSLSARKEVVKKSAPNIIKT